MSKTPLKQAINEMFDEVKLSRDELAALHELESADVQPATDIRRRRFLATAASVSAIAVTGGLVWQMRGPADPLDEIFTEIAHVHLAKMPLDFQGSAIADLRAAFAPQGFMVSDSEPLRQLDGNMQGGRFCWLLKQAAAEFRYKLQSGGWATVIQTAYKPQVFGKLPDIGHGKTPIVRFVRGLECSVWCDRDMVYAQARPA